MPKGSSVSLNGRKPARPELGCVHVWGAGHVWGVGVHMGRKLAMRELWTGEPTNSENKFEWGL